MDTNKAVLNAARDLAEVLVNSDPTDEIGSVAHLTDTLVKALEANGALVGLDRDEDPEPPEPDENICPTCNGQEQELWVCQDCGGTGRADE